MRRWIYPPPERVLYWRCVWANKVLLMHFLAVVTFLVTLAWFLWYRPATDEPVHFFAWSLVQVSFAVALMLGVITGMGRQTVDTYREVQEHVRRTGHTDCSCLAWYRKHYCWSAGMKLALRDVRRGIGAGPC